MLRLTSHSLTANSTVMIKKLSSPLAKKFYAPHIDAVFVLNLDKRTDRWMNAKSQLKKAKFDVELDVNRISGIDGVELFGGRKVVDDFMLHHHRQHQHQHRDDASKSAKLEIQRKAQDLVNQGLITQQAAQRLVEVPTQDKLYGMDLTFGAIGCALGHRRIWELIAANGLEGALVLEDDVEFNPSIARQFAERWSHVPKDWELVYLGGVDLLREGKPPRPFVAEGVRYAYKGQRELTAYVLNHKSARACLAMTKPLAWQIDTHICMNCRYHDAAKDELIASPLSYCFQPALAIQVAKFGTDVQKQHEGVQAASLTDASRRMREFVGGETSVR